MPVVTDSGGARRSGRAGRPARRGLVLAALMLTMALAAMDTTIVATTVPQIVGDIGGFSLFSWLFSVYLLTQTVTIPIYGKLADLYGRRPVLLIGIGAFLLASALCSLAWSMVALIAFRALQGIGAGSIQATVQTVAGDLYSLEERGRVQGWLSSVWGVAAVAGPTLGGLFADYASWRWVFLVNLPIGAVALLLLVRHLHEAAAPARQHRIDYLGSAGTLLACAVLVFALLQGGVEWAWLSVPSIGCFALAAVLVVGTIAVERRAAEPVVPGWVWRRRVLAGANLSYVGLGLLVIGPSTFLPTYAQTVLGYGAVAAGFVLASMSVSWPLAAALCSHLYLRIGFRDTALIGAVLALAGVGGFVLLPYAAPVWAAVASTLVLGAGLGLISTPLVVGVQSTVVRGERGVATGSLMFCRFLGQSLGAAVFGAIVNSTLRARLAHAPGSLGGLPPADGVTSVLVGGQEPPRVGDYLRHAMDAATSSVYLALTVVGALTVLAVLVTPRRFPVLPTGPRAVRDGNTPAAAALEPGGGPGTAGPPPSTGVVSGRGS
ncbi:MAG: arabinose efflux permease family protein [Modestobacter sp.]|nr:arabinose efflux permease family protein [Modestobacter sp.]